MVPVWLWRGCVLVRLPFRRVLSCEIGTAEGKPQVEEYGLDELAASAEAVLAGLGPLAAGLARLAGDAGQAVTLDAMELLVIEQGRELLRGLVQLGLDGQAEREVRLAAVTGADGVRRSRAERGHARPVVTRLGEVVVRRIAYRSGVKGAGSLFPRDAVLNLPPCGYSWALQRLAEMFARSGSYAQAREFVLAATGVSIGKRQLEQVTVAAAADAERFCQDPGRPRDEVVLPGTGEEGGLPPLVISADGKGVAMRPEARRRCAKAPGKRVRTFARRAGTGEKKGCKRMAETGCVFDVQPPDGPPRTPEEIMTREPGEPARGPRAVNRWYTCDITASRAETIATLLDQAGRRDPGHRADLDRPGRRGQPPDRGVPRRGGQAGHHDHDHDRFHPRAGIPVEGRLVLPPAPRPGDGRLGDHPGPGHPARPRRRRHCPDPPARRDHPPRPGSEHAKIIRTTLHYLDAKQSWMDYPRALANGWPIATGVIEGACRHLVQDRMGITGARWGLQGAQAILWLRAINASGDHDAYWDYHIQQEHQRNHLSRYKNGLDLAA